MRMKVKWVMGAALLGGVLLGGGLARGNTLVYLSTKAGNTLAGVQFKQGDIVAYDLTESTASLFLDGSAVFRRANGNLAGSEENIDALAIQSLPDGKVLISMAGEAYLGKPTQSGGTLHFLSGDVVLYDKINDTATMFFEGAAHFRKSTSSWPIGAAENIDAFELLANGDYLISTKGNDARLGTNHLEFDSSDIVEYDPVNDTASIYFSKGLWRKANGTFGDVRNVDGVAINPSNGHLLLSTSTDGLDKSRLGSPLYSFSDGDIVDYDRAADKAVLFFDQALFLVHCDNDDVDAFDVVGTGFGGNGIPEPLTLLAVGSAVAGIAGYIRRRSLA